MADTQSNRITVNLELLASEDAKLLQKFGDEFSKSVNSLKMIMEGFAGQMAAAAQQVTQAAARNTGGGGGGGGIANPLGTGHSTPDNEPSRQEMLARKWGYYYRGQQGEDYSFLTQPRYGAFTAQDYLRQLAYAFGNRGMNQAKEAGVSPFGDNYVDGELIPQPANNALKWSQRFGKASNYAPVGAGVKSGIQTIGKIRSILYGPTAAGLQAGQVGVGGGWGGTAFMSPAYRTGMMQNARAMWGVVSNPFSYSMGQANDASSAISGYGYMGQQFNNLFSQVQDLQMATGMSGAQAMQFLDPAMRYGTANIGALKTQLIAMSQAAHGAGIATDVFRQGVIQASQSLAGNSLAPSSYIAAGLTSLSTTYGINPSTAAGMYQNSTLNSINMALKGGPWQAMMSKTQGLDRVNATNMFLHFAGITGGMAGVAHIASSGNGQFMPQKEALAYMAQMGMLPMPFAAMLRAGRIGNTSLRHRAVAGDLINMGLQQGWISHPQLRQAMSLVGWSPSKQAAALASLHTTLNGHPAMTQRALLQKLAQQLGNNTNQGNKVAASKNQFGLTPEARRILMPLMNSQEGVSHSNAGGPSPLHAIANDVGGFAAGAAGGATTGAAIGGTVGSIVPGVGTGVGLAAGGLAGGLVGGVGSLF